MGRSIGSVGLGSSALMPVPAGQRRDLPAPETIENCAPSQPQRIGRPARVGPALEHAALLIRDDGTDGAGKPRPVRPPSNFVAEAAERLAGCLVDPALHIEQARMIGVRLE